MDGEAWWATVHGIAESDTTERLHFHFHSPTPVFLGFPCGSAGKESACNVGDLGSIPGLGRSPGEGKGNHSIVHGFA